MAKAKNPAGTKGVMDVTHPDKATPSGNSKSVIVPSRPLLQDPMVVTEAGKTAPPEAGTDKAQPAPKMLPKAPPETSADPLLETPATDTSAKAAAKPETAATNTVPAKSDASKPATDSDDAGDGSEADKPEPSTDKNLAKADKIPPKPDAAAEEQAKRQAAVDKLVDGKKYYLPIDTLEKKRSRRFVALGVLLSLLLIVAWADIALDAGLISSSGAPHTHFFDKQTIAAAVTTTPSQTFKRFTAKASKLAFRYPADWDFSSAGSDTTSDTISLSPSGSGIVGAGSGVLINFSNQFSSSEVTGPLSFLIEYVHYQKLPKPIAGNVYLADVIYQSSNARGTTINIRGSLTDNNTQAAGQTVQTLDQSFQNADRSGTIQFTITVVPAAATGSATFSSVDAAKQFIQTTDYQQARAVLLSTTVAKP